MVTPPEILGLRWQGGKTMNLRYTTRSRPAGPHSKIIKIKACKDWRRSSGRRMPVLSTLLKQHDGPFPEPEYLQGREGGESISSCVDMQPITDRNVENTSCSKEQQKVLGNWVYLHMYTVSSLNHILKVTWKSPHIFKAETKTREK